MTFVSSKFIFISRIKNINSPTIFIECQNITFIFYTSDTVSIAMPWSEHFVFGIVLRSTLLGVFWSVVPQQGKHHLAYKTSLALFHSDCFLYNSESCTKTYHHLDFPTTQQFSLRMANQLFAGHSLIKRSREVVKHRHFRVSYSRNIDV